MLEEGAGIGIVDRRAPGHGKLLFAGTFSWAGTKQRLCGVRLLRDDIAGRSRLRGIRENGL
jgi:hypothetical protein